MRVLEPILLLVFLASCGENSGSELQNNDDRQIMETQIGETLEEIIYDEDLTALKNLLAQNPELATHRLQSKRMFQLYYDPTVLMYAGARGWTEGVDLLLAQGASLHETTTNGVNAILFALRFCGPDGAGVADFVKRCVEAGVDPHATTLWGSDALDAVCSVRPDEVARRLTEYLYSLGLQDQCEFDEESCCPSAIFIAVEINPAVLSVMLRHQPELLECRDENGETPLQVAIDALAWKSIELLLKAGADPATTVDRGRTALHDISSMPYGVNEFNQDIVLNIIRLSKSVLNKHDDDGWAPLHLAVQNHSRLENDQDGLPLYGKLLLESGADPNVKGPAGKTPFQLAAEAENRAWVELLLRFDADPHVQNTSGEAPAEVLSYIAVSDLD